MTRRLVAELRGERRPAGQPPRRQLTLGTSHAPLLTSGTAGKLLSSPVRRAPTLPRRAQPCRTPCRAESSPCPGQSVRPASRAASSPPRSSPLYGWRSATRACAVAGDGSLRCVPGAIPPFEPPRVVVRWLVLAGACLGIRAKYARLRRPRLGPNPDANLAYLPGIPRTALTAEKRLPSLRLARIASRPLCPAPAAAATAASAPVPPRR